MIDPNFVGSFLLYLAIVLAAFSALASIVGRIREDGRLMIAGERAGYAVGAIPICASLILVNAFLDHDYANKYVQRYSDNNMPWYYLVASFWGGQAGSLMFWSLVLGVISNLVIWQNRNQNRDILPTVIAVLMVVQGFFLTLMILEANPFAVHRINEPPINGNGLEPLLQNPAMTFHPPSILSGYIWFTVPFAFAVAAVIHNRLNDDWIRTTRRYAVVSWGFLSIGNLFGGMWAYQELGWGGFWGWDPVENASLMPWFTATAYLHSVMIQERRGMLKVWNLSLVFLTYFLTIFGTFLTRSGLIESVHTFAQSDIGDYFMVFLAILAVFSIGLIVWRILDGSLKNKGNVESLMSREGVFLINNLLLLGCMGVVMFGTLGEKISDYFWQKTTYTAAWFNGWMVPGGLALIILMGIGPLIPWRKTSMKALRTNFLVPTVVSMIGTYIVYALDIYGMKSRVAATNVPMDKVNDNTISLAQLPLEAELTGVYALIGFFGVIFVVYTLMLEIIRGTLVRRKSTGESFFHAMTRLFMKQKRRYGGYLTHLGFAGLFLGFIGTGLKTKTDLEFQGEETQVAFADHILTYKGMKDAENREYSEWFAQFEVHEEAEDGSKGRAVGMLNPSRRNYVGARKFRTTSEKDEIFLWHGNVYLTLSSFNQDGSYVSIEAHYNPMLIYMWIGGGILLFGVTVVLWPDANPYPVFAASRRRKRKVAAGAATPHGELITHEAET